MVAAIYAFTSRTFLGRAILAVSQDPGALRLVGGNPVRVKEFAFGLSIATAVVAGALLIIIQPVEPSLGREYIGRVFAICVLGSMTSLGGTLLASIILGIAEALTATFVGPSWAPAVAFGLLIFTLVCSGRDIRTVSAPNPSSRPGHPSPGGRRAVTDSVEQRGDRLVRLCVGRLDRYQYAYLATYTILQYVVLATAWNIFGGYAGCEFWGRRFLCARRLCQRGQLQDPAIAAASGDHNRRRHCRYRRSGMGYSLPAPAGIFLDRDARVLGCAQYHLHQLALVGGARGVSVLRPDAPAFFGTYPRYLLA
jgi:hypothetical protein